MNLNFPSAMTQPTQPNLPTPKVGYRFRPTDYELVDHFLRRKILGHADDEPLISEIKVCDFEPWDLPALFNTYSDDQVWYFFCTRDYKYPRSARSNRTTRAGYWKPTGKPRYVKAKFSEEEIGTKRSLVFYIKENPKPKRTKWIMHEYECIQISTLDAKGNFLLCKLKLNPDEETNKGGLSRSACDLVLENQDSNEVLAVSSSDEHEPSIHLGFGFEDDILNDMTATYDQSEQDCLEEMRTDSTGESHYYLYPEMETQIRKESGIKPMDSGFQNPDQKTDISETSEKGDQPRKATTAYENNDTSTSLTAAGLQNITLIEVDDSPEGFYDRLEAFLELQDDLYTSLF